jgi:rod shape-determining protein MreD
MKRVAILIAVGLVAVLCQATLFAYLPWGWPKPDFVLIIVLYIGFFLSPTEGGVISFLLGYFMDLFAGHVMGLFTFTRVSAWFLSKLSSGVLHLRSVPAQTLFVALYTGLDALILVGALRFFGGPDYPLPKLGSRIWIQAALNGVSAPFVITALQRVERRFSPSLERKRLDFLS